MDDADNIIPEHTEVPMELWLDDVLFLIVISSDSANYYLHTTSHGHEMRSFLSSPDNQLAEPTNQKTVMYLEVGLMKGKSFQGVQLKSSW